MEGTVVTNIANLAKERKPVELGGLVYIPNDWKVTNPKHTLDEESERPSPLPVAPVFAVSTLGALRDYLKENRDELDSSKLIVHVETPFRVSVGSVLRANSRDREVFITATVRDLLVADNFLGTFKSQEEMVIGLQTRFVPTEARAAVLRVVGTIKEDAVSTSNDDGVTQTVTASAGTVLVGSTNLPNPVELQGYRTFRDIRQPSVPYVLRGKKGQNGAMPNVALFEADGGAWQLGTIADIHNWLKENLPAEVAVLA